MSAASRDHLNFDANGRMRHHPVYHPNQNKPWSCEELEYLSVFYKHDDIRTLSYALGRTETSVRNKYWVMRKRGLIDVYKKIYFKRLRS